MGVKHWYSRTPLIRPPSESHWCGRIRGMVAREGFIYEQKPLSVTRYVVVWEGWSFVRGSTVLRKLYIKRINAFEMKCVYSSIVNELHLPSNWLYNFVRHHQLKYFCHVTRHNYFREDNNARNVSRVKEQRKAKTKMEERKTTDLFGMIATASRLA